MNGNQSDFASHFYEEVNNVIGGTNPNEKLTLLLPGIALTKSDFEYDYKNNKPKGPVVEANESRLANKLYDPFDMVGGDNGKTLDHQYRSAINMLTPKLNPIMAEAKNQLRELLLKPFPYKFGPRNIKRAQILVDGNWTDAPEKAEENPIDENATYTFQEVFFRLYNDYVEQLAEWADERQRHKEYYEKLAEENASLADEAAKSKWSENKYLQWYEDNGEKWLTAINQKMSILLSVFSDNDMKIIEGILDSGSGAELQEARQTMNNTKKINPDGGYIYPVKFNPTNWFEYLDTSFTPVDLVNSPTAIFDELKISYTKRDFINTRIAEISAQIPTKGQFDEQAKAVSSAKETYLQCDQALQDAMDKGFGDFAKFLAVTICSACCPPAGIAAAAGSTAAELVKSKKAIKETVSNATDVTEKITKALTTASKGNQQDAAGKLSGILDSVKSAFTSPTVTNAISGITGLADKLTNGKASELLQTLDSSINDTITKADTTINNLLGKASLNQTEKNNLEAAQKEKQAAEQVKAASDEVKNTDDAQLTQKLDYEIKSDASAEGFNETLNKALQSAKEDNSGLNIASEINKGIDIVFEGSNKVNLAQDAYLTSIDNYTTALLNYTRTSNLQNYAQQLNNLNIEKQAIESKIKQLENKLSRVDDFEQCFSESVNPPSVPDGFTQINIVHNNSKTESSSFSKESVSVSSKTKGFWIFKSKKRTTESKSYIESMCNSMGTEIQIGMNIAKVGIERSWFNPGIFALTGEMYNVATKTTEAKETEQRDFDEIDYLKGKKIEDTLRISHGAEKDDPEHMYRLSHDVFPCYPTAMVIARDVTIKLTTTNSTERSKMREVTKEMSNSKAFFVYNAGDGSKSHTSTGKSKSSSDGHAITVRFTTPQIIGFFQQIVPEDISAKYPVQIPEDDSTIVNFISKYEEVIRKRDNLTVDENAESSEVAIDETAE